MWIYYKKVNLNWLLRLMMNLHFSGKDNILPSRDEGQRLMNSLQDCVVLHFKGSGHTLLLVCDYMYIHHITSWLALIISFKFVKLLMTSRFAWTLTSLERGKWLFLDSLISLFLYFLFYLFFNKSLSLSCILAGKKNATCLILTREPT